jgi:restriction system protein
MPAAPTLVSSDVDAEVLTTIVLIDGKQLADLMIEFGVGVSDVETIRLKRVDEDYFGEE